MEPRAAGALLAALLLPAAALGEPVGLGCGFQLTDAAGRSHAYELRGRAGPRDAYPHGVVAPAGHYAVEERSGWFNQNASFVFQLCEDMRFADAADAPVCGAAGTAADCPTTCVSDGVCGAGCGALMALGTKAYRSCFNMGEWAVATTGVAADVAFVDPARPELGVAYTMEHGDTDFSCPSGRRYTVELLCPAKGGRAGHAQPPTPPRRSPGPCHYTTTLVHPGACPVRSSGGHRSSGSSHHGMSWGGYFLVFFHVFLVVYIVGGIVVNHANEGTTGCPSLGEVPRLMPHGDFWREVAALVKEGAEFLWSKATGSREDQGGHYTSLW